MYRICTVNHDGTVRNRPLDEIQSRDELKAITMDETKNWRVVERAHVYDRRGLHLMTSHCHEWWVSETPQ